MDPPAVEDSTGGGSPNLLTHSGLAIGYLRRYFDAGGAGAVAVCGWLSMYMT